MEDSLATFNWVALLPMGVALHWSLHLIYGGRRGRSDGVPMITLNISAWLFILAGVLGPIMVFGGPLGLLLIVAFFGASIMIVEKYRSAEGRSLFWFLAVAAERQWSLAEAARSFAADRADETGRRADRLADLLEAGMPLPDALKQSKNRLPLDAQLAAQLGYETGRIAGTLKEAAQRGGRFAPIWEPFFQRLLYLIVVVGFGLVLIEAFSIVVIPNFWGLFQDFGIDLPPLTRAMMEVSSLVSRYSPLMVLLSLPVVGVLVVGALMILGKISWEPRPVAWFTRRYHGALVLQSLAQAVELQRPLDETFARLARCYPRGHVRRRLKTAANEMEAGTHWCDALKESALIAAADAAVLRAAERVGNLPWALREMTSSAMRRLATRLNLAVSLGIPGAIIAIGVVVGLFACAVIQPMVKLVLSLT